MKVKQANKVQQNFIVLTITDYNQNYKNQERIVQVQMVMINFGNWLAKREKLFNKDLEGVWIGSFKSSHKEAVKRYFNG